jgi:hypothetical protein
MSVDAASLPRVQIDPSTRLSPDWWLVQLEKALEVKRPNLERLAQYAAGDAPLMDIAKAAREAYLDFQKRSRTNFAGLSIDMMMDRFHIAAIRTGATGDQQGDSQAWDMWQANQLDADSPALHRAMFSMGEAFAIVGDVDPDVGAPLVTIEDPRNIAIACNPARRRQIRAAVKTFTDEWTGLDHAYLYMRGAQGRQAMVWRAERIRSALGAVGKWQWIGDPDFPAMLPFQQVPVVWFPNQLDIDGRSYWGEFEKHTDVLDRINSTILQRLVTSSMQAFRQRMLKGLPVKDENGNDIDYDGVFAADPAALWQVPEGVEVWESQMTDITPMLLAARDDIKDFAAVMRMPLPSTSPDSQNQSAAGTELVESGLIHKVTDRMGPTSESWEDVCRLMFMWIGDTTRSSARDMEILWTPPAIPSLAERFDAASKAKAAGMPDDWIRLNIIGMSPQEISRRASEPLAPPIPAVPAAP